MGIAVRSMSAAACVSAVLFGLTGASALAQRAAPARFEMTVDGPILVSDAGMTLYRHSDETAANGAVRWQCTDQVVQPAPRGERANDNPRLPTGVRQLRSCLEKFHPLPAPANAQSSEDFSVVERPDGARQWAYRGQPLYTSVRDVRPGERNGAGRGFGSRRGGMSYIVRRDNLPGGLQYQRAAAGLVLVTEDNATPVYTPRRNGRFLRARADNDGFRPIVAPALATTRGDWSIVDSDAGQRQYAYHGQPLFMPPIGMNRLQLQAQQDWEPVVVVPAPAVPDAIGQHLTLLGDVYTDQRGMTLYAYTCNGGFGGGGLTCEMPGDPAAFMVALCGDPAECARRWRPYVAARNARPVGEFSIIEITNPMFTDVNGALYPEDGNHVRVWAYRGSALFTYYEDEKPGDTWGDRVGGIWGSTFNAAMAPGRGATDFEP